MVHVGQVMPERVVHTQGQRHLILQMLSWQIIGKEEVQLHSNEASLQAGWN